MEVARKRGRDFPTLIVTWKLYLKPLLERVSKKKKNRFLFQQYHGGSKKEREKSLEKVRAKGGVCLTSYGMVSSNTADFVGENGFRWDCVILDEGCQSKLLQLVLLLGLLFYYHYCFIIIDIIDIILLSLLLLLLLSFF